MSSDSQFDTPHRLHPAAIIIKFGTYFIATVRSMAAPIAGIFITGRGSSAQYMTLLIGGSIAFIGAISIIFPVLHYFSTVFYIRGDALEISSGFIWRKKRTIPLARIQNVNVERTLWHRILGAAAVKVETATGKKGEGDLAALSVADANKLQAALLHHQAGEEVIEAVQKPEPLYQLSPKQVILAGALGNRAVYIMGSMFAVIQADASHQFFGPVFKYFANLGPMMAALVGAVSFLVLILVGWLLSIGISATRFFGFRIERHERGLLLTHGLITQFKSIVPIGRIQDVRICEPILFRLLGYCEIYADTAGAFDAKDAASANKICPILPESEANKIGQLLMPEFQFGGLDWRRVSRKTIARHAARHIWLYVILLSWPLAHWAGWYGLLAVPPVVVYAWLTGVISYQYVGYSWTNDVLAARRGIFRKQAIVIPFDRIQRYTIYSTWTQKLMGLATVSAMSAATGGHAIVIADMEIEAAEALRKTIGASIESHLGSRRGGL